MWRLADRGTRWSRSDFGDETAALAAADAAEALALPRQLTRTQEWMANRDADPQWHDAGVATRPTIEVMAGVHALAWLAMFWSPIRGLREMPVPSGEAGAGAQGSGRWSSGSTATPRKRIAT